VRLVANPFLPQVYALADPDTGEIRYIGQSKSGGITRFYLHLTQADHYGKVKTWIHALRAVGKRPQLFILEDDPDNILTAEKHWIDFGRQRGWPLLNCQAGNVKGWKRGRRNV
jgi:hypothetical protein